MMVTSHLGPFQFDTGLLNIPLNKKSGNCSTTAPNSNCYSQEFPQLTSAPSLQALQATYLTPQSSSTGSIPAAPPPILPVSAHLLGGLDPLSTPFSFRLLP